MPSLWSLTGFVGQIVAVPAEVLDLTRWKIQFRYPAAATWARADEPPPLISKPAGRGDNPNLAPPKRVFPAQGIGQRSIDD